MMYWVSSHMSGTRRCAKSVAGSSEPAELQERTADLKHDYADVFAETSLLPPDRSVEHVVPMLLNEQTSSQRMYRMTIPESQ